MVPGDSATFYEATDPTAFAVADATVTLVERAAGDDVS